MDASPNDGWGYGLGNKLKSSKDIKLEYNQSVEYLRKYCGAVSHLYCFVRRNSVLRFISMSTALTISLQARAERLDNFAIIADDFATARICRTTAARIGEIASEIDRLREKE